MTEYHGLDTPERVCFYEQDFYVLSNFSAFNIRWNDIVFDTSERVYHWEKFNSRDPIAKVIQQQIVNATSAHNAFKIGQKPEYKPFRVRDWDSQKVEVMRDIIITKARQHAYVYKKLMDTGDRELVENSWRDDFWGWGPNKDGQNMLGKLWMEVRRQFRLQEGRFG